MLSGQVHHVGVLSVLKCSINLRLIKYIWGFCFSFFLLGIQMPTQLREFYTLSYFGACLLTRTCCSAIQYHATMVVDFLKGEAGIWFYFFREGSVAELLCPGGSNLTVEGTVALAVKVEIVEAWVKTVFVFGGWLGVTSVTAPGVVHPHYKLDNKIDDKREKIKAGQVSIG